jgi:hypothetical protein
MCGGLIPLGLLGCDQVVGMVTMCTPNGFGDLMLNMKVTMNITSLVLFMFVCLLVCFLESSSIHGGFCRLTCEM